MLKVQVVLELTQVLSFEIFIACVRKTLLEGSKLNLYLLT